MNRQNEPTFRKMPGLTDTRTENRFGKAPGHLQNSSLKPSGYVILTDELGMKTDAETVMCMHCQFHWVIVLGSGMKRGFCLNCNGPTCGKQLCETRCIHFEKAIELMERRR